MADLSSVHDSFVRAILADRQVAIDYFRTALPQHLVQQLDFSTFRQLPGSYVSDELRQSISDVVYSCGVVGSPESVEVCLLLEHKSSKDIYAPLQIGSYLYSGYLQQVKQKRKRLSPIIPVLFYHGKQKWEYGTTGELFDGLKPELLAYIPDFQYIYHSLRELPDEALRDHDNRFLAASLLVLKHAFNKEWLRGNFTGVLSIGLPEGSHDLKQALLLYVFGRVDLAEERLKEAIRELPSTIQEDVMSTYEILVEKGRKEGAEKERARLEALLQAERAKAEVEKQEEKLRSARELKKLGVPVADIARGLSLSVELVEKL